MSNADSSPSQREDLEVRNNHRNDGDGVVQKPIAIDVKVNERLEKEDERDEIAKIRRELGVTEPIAEQLSERDIFSLDGIDHHVAKQFQPKYLARGGNQIVYDIPAFPTLVAKADTQILKLNMDKNKEEGKPLDELNDRKRAMEYLRYERSRFQRMKSYFGKEHILGQAKILQKVPVTSRILAEIYEGQIPGPTDEAWTAITLQRRAEELQDAHRLNLVGGYAEIQPELTNDAEYSSVTASLLDGNTKNSPTVQAFLRVQNNDGLNDLVANAEQDADLKKVLCDLVQKVIRYTNETGEILDLAGNDNITVFQKDGKWTYRLIDALYPMEIDNVENTRKAIQKLAYDQVLDKDDQGCLFNVLNFTRTINGLASYLGVQQRIEIVPEHLRGIPIDFKAGLKEIIQRAH